jgi:putative RNA 2'-phosphotransferase
VKKHKMEGLSKFFTKILRHNPKDFGLTLGKNHYCKLDDFYKAVLHYWSSSPLSKEEVSYVLLNSKWQSEHRFDIWKGYVRASYKHTYNQTKREEKEIAE